MGEWAVWSGESGSNEQGKEEEESSEQPVWGSGLERGGGEVERRMESGADQRSVGGEDDES